MSNFRITIVGLGATGASLGLALKEADRELRIIGHDREPTAAAAARKAGAVDHTEWNLPTACRGSQLIILALPLAAIRDTLAAVASDLEPGCLVTDTAPLKVAVLDWARAVLPPSVDFVGGDPLFARGLHTAPSAALFNGVTYCFCPAPGASGRALERASDLAQAVGATPRFLDPIEHDGLAAALDALPFLLAA
ncbi:MAG: prephenate dehydrogenase, partial [Anaerolineae bacterium]